MNDKSRSFGRRPGDNRDGRNRGGRAQKLARSKLFRSTEEELEGKLGFELFTEGEPRLGWLLTFASSSWEDQDSNRVFSCVDLYFVSQDGSMFKSKYKFSPYFYAATKENMQLEVEAFLRRRYEGQIADIEIVDKEDLSLKNHLSGLRKLYLKICFDTVQQLMHVKNDLVHIVERNKKKLDAAEAYASIFNEKSEQKIHDYLDCIIDLREYDVPYHVRFTIDNDIRCGQWYNVYLSSTGVTLEKSELLNRAEVRVCAFDIETTKLPLKFPDAEYDEIMMISYMVDGRGYLIINRECVSEDIEDLEYTPKPEFEGRFKVKNVKNEEELLSQWFTHMRELKPGIYVTYNGDFFDWPFLESRATRHGISMNNEIGFRCDSNQGECRARFACHLDCFAWVKRDSYLPQGSQGLKAVTKAKLGYDPLEVNPEDMVRFAKEQPQTMASYSVSDAVSTYYLYMTYVHPFIFSLATIIPMPPDEVLRKGSGTLCEMLLMVQAYKANVICPNKHQEEPEKFYNSRLLESETYIGGHVECLESGVFRSDLPTKFRLDSSAYEQLISNLDRDLQHAIKVEGKMDLDSISNYDDVKNAIMEKLVNLRDESVREESPLIYHLDVAAMYPNIILTNRLQPPSIVTDEVCTACDFNRPGKTCLRNLEWVWRGETFMAKRSEYYHLKQQMESELVDDGDGQSMKSFCDLPKAEQQSKFRERLKKYCQKVYKRVIDKPATELREAGICMRENSFYVDTVRSFRDRRYEYKDRNKVWKGKLAEAKASGNPMKIQEAQDMVVLFDSLQLAHKCILNSFYGYVMRKGARWYSMEMAGVVTYTGAKIIQNARLLVERIGRPLELDTDGIWCALPGSFPENFTFKTKDLKRKLTISYPCVMLNADVARNNTNDQYQTLTDPVSKTYTTHSECSIMFEVDGPYKAMILPASKEEGVLIKKRYAVFNDDGTLAELKGFEIKRRGELKLIKVFQAEVFDKFLHGTTLDECYAAVASVANRWLDLLDNQGIDIADSELLDYISESSTMSKSLADYGEQKSCAVTTARRLADFLGDAMVKDKGLRCQYIVSCEPRGTPVSERALPVAIFEDPEHMKFFVRKWCKISSDVGIRSIVDWSYYRQRLSSAIQKIITIPAAMQKVANPVSRVMHPDWLHRKVREKEDRFRQKSIRDIFNTVNRDANLQKSHSTNEAVMDMEDIGNKENIAIQGLHPIVRCYQNNVGNSPGELFNSDNVLQQSDMQRQHQALVGLNQNSSLAESIHWSVDYEGWLASKKRKWKDVREERKKQRLGNPLKQLHPTTGSRELAFGTKNRNSELGRNSVGSFFRSRELALLHSYWQIIQLVSSPQLGQFFAWVVVEGVMLKVPIKVPRAFYLNTRASITEGFPGNRVTLTLPHGRPSFNLIEVKVDEYQFKAVARKLAAHLADPEVEGIYETKMPLEYSAILQIGCVCKVDKTAQNRSIQDGWRLDELHMKTTTECPYLEQPISFFYLYHSMSEARAMYVVYTPASSNIHVVVVNPFQNKELSSNLLEKQFREACQVLSCEPSLPGSSVIIKVDYVGNAKDAERLLQGALTEFRHEHPRPTVGVIECPNMQTLESHLPVLDDFPCVTIPCNARDNQYQALGWQIIAAKIGMQRCAASSQWLKERIALAKYAHIPLANFELDWLLHTADVFFSRALHDQQQVLWISDDGIPDLGGIHEDDSCFLDEVSSYNKFYLGSSTLVTLAILQINLQVFLLPVMRKVFALLLAEFRKLGASIIYADFSKVIIDTGKLDLSSAQGYCDCLLKALQSRDLFEWIVLEPLRFWHSLLFMDQYNYGGIQAKVPNGIPEDVSSTPNLNADYGSQLDIISSWNIAEYLPKATQDYFILIVSEFIYEPWKEQAAIRAASRNGSFCTPSVTLSATETYETQVTEFLKKKISSYFLRKVLGFIHDINRHIKGKKDIIDESISHGFPPLAGSHIHIGDPALEFIKHVCKVLALDQHVQHDVLVMKKNLLKLIRVKEFAPEAQYRDPCLSFTLPNVICSYCNDCRDLDICRDAMLLDRDWRCAVPQCGQPYNREEIENTLIQIVRQREHLYHLQDLVCVRCRGVKGAHLAEQCECGGFFRCFEDATEFKAKMQVFLNIAMYHQFPILGEFVSWIMEIG
ncbi:DNA polymerase epsilon catalytic subunit A [Amborella trichopoda]|nr:DNA polymerase epsilon catalytic subunit A [Amborella trichopoda]|eukprot:XP_020527261.1 DNA polymerase epsilon catalytic subunit A [Amborella trichopoda]